ncbi:hypothetical protein [Bifidobacterium olomucense]|uniref:Uncharacterized protein n=1 Tax=Bifidobacterium olomucense TaxID=2675324 RepID=A0A7Y0EXC9_9BIFI|nr:hypothetical protein [Bifidobacterium sp. DSM 109959]NMM98155.1 hypothetical protein [Bifidobacterium sp. DSM 109959]
MASVFRSLALDVRPQLDAESLVFDLLKRVYDANPMFSDVHVQSEINLTSNDYAANGRLIIVSTGSPYQSEAKAWVWRIPLTFAVLGSNPDGASELAADLYRTVMEWPFSEGTSVGAVSRIISFTGFQRVNKLKENQGKSITEYASDCLIEAHDRYGR